MKKGDTVKIYEDPYTEEIVEGEAKLIKKIKGLDKLVEYWQVKFIEDDYVCLRKIKVG